MIKEIVKDVLFLNQKSEKATEEDKQVVLDLLDTLEANKGACVGLAANMIGVKKRIIAVTIGEANIAMINPVIVKRSGEYDAQEGCLSLSGVRRAVRYNKIEVEFLDINFQKQKQKFSGWTAQIIQHEIDHCNGILI